MFVVQLVLFKAEMLEKWGVSFNPATIHVDKFEWPNASIGRVNLNNC